jgi:hypothetical protein
MVQMMLTSMIPSSQPLSCALEVILLMIVCFDLRGMKDETGANGGV